MSATTIPLRLVSVTYLSEVIPPKETLLNDYGKTVAKMLAIAAGLSLFVKYVLPLGITSYTRVGLWCTILVPVCLLGLGMAYRSRQTL